jgi:hypothetical protein
VAHTCNRSNLGGWGLEDHNWRPAWANSLQDLISKITRTKWTEGVAQAVEHLLCKHKALSSNSSPTKEKKRMESLIRLSLIQKKSSFSSLCSLCLGLIQWVHPWRMPWCQPDSRKKKRENLWQVSSTKTICRLKGVRTSQQVFMVIPVLWLGRCSVWSFGN